MKQDPPLILLVFATEVQEGTPYLRNIAEEERVVREVLEPAIREGLCEVEVLPNATLKQLFDTFQKERFRDRIAIFHFGGHANSYGLLLEQSSEAHAEGLVPFLGSQQGLQLVFLNGCSTELQALRLNEAGIPLVIGTYEAINDEAARTLAERFYKGLGQGLNIQQSWDQSIDNVLSKTRGDLRGIGWQDTALDRFPWQLFRKKGAEKALEWNLPDAANDPLSTIPLPIRYNELPETPYRYLERYKKTDAAIFFGRSHYIRELYVQLTNPLGMPVVQLCGQSGVGKSSMLEAGLLPRLEVKSAVFYLRRNPEKGLLNTILETLEVEAGTSAGTSLSEAWKAVEARYQKPLTVILDQVEEAFTRPGSRGPEELYELADALNRLFSHPEQRPKGKILLSFRKEYALEIQTVLKNQQIPRAAIVFLEKMTRPELIEVVNGLASSPALVRKYGLEVEENLAEVIASDLLNDSESAITPILQVVLTKLWQGLPANGEDRKFTVENYQKLKEKGILLIDFFREQMVILRNWEHTIGKKIESSGLALDILNEHVTDQGYSVSRKLEDLRKMYSHRLAELNEALLKFKELYLLTDTGNDCSGLAHDSLGKEVLSEVKNSEKPGQKARRILNVKMDSYRRAPKQTYLDINDLRTIKNGESGMRNLEADEIALIKQSEARHLKKRILSIIRAVVIGALFILAAWFGIQYSKKYRIEQWIAQARQEAVTDPALALQTLQKALEIDSDNPMTLSALSDIYNDTEITERTFPFPLSVRGVFIAPDGSDTFYAWTDSTIYCRHRRDTLADSFPIAGLSTVQLSPDGKWLAAATWSGDLILLETNGLNQVQKARPLKAFAVTQLAFSADVKTLYVAGGKELVALDIDNLRQIKGGFSLDKMVSALAMHPYHKTLLLGYEDGLAEERSIEGRTLVNYPGHNDKILAFAISAADTGLVTTGRDAIIKFWDQQGHLKLTLKGHNRAINSLAWSPDGQRLFSASNDHQIKCWSPEGDWITTYKGHTHFVNAIAIAPDGRSFVSAGEDHTVHWWKVESRVVQHFGPMQNGVSKAVFCPGSKTILTASDAGVNDANDFSQNRNFNPRSLFSAISTQNPRVGMVWDITTGEKLFELKGHTGAINAAAANIDGRYATASDDKTIMLWNKEGKIEKVLSGVHHSRVLDLTFSSDGKYLLSGGADSVFALWSADGALIKSLKLPDIASAVAFSPDAKSFAIGSFDGLTRIFDLQGKAGPTMGTIGDFRVETIAFSPDGRKILCGHLKNWIKLYDLNGKQLLETQMLVENKTGAAAIRSLAFSPDGKWFCAGAEGGLATIYRLTNQSIIPVYELPHYPRRTILSVCFSADGKYLLTGSNDHWARIWRIDYR